jgi:hypothetical protein
MKRNSNTIRLTEQEFNALIEESVKRIINEGKWGDALKNVGKKVGKGAAATAFALGAGALGVSPLLDEPNHIDNGNPETEITMPSQEEKAIDWLETHGMEVNDENIAKVFNQLGESKFNSRLDRIIKEEISKVL